MEKGLSGGGTKLSQFKSKNQNIQKSQNVDYN